MPTARLTILDGPMGSELLARGVATPLPGWSAHALLERPEVVTAIHRAYAEAGAEVHTADTFRATRRVFPSDWQERVRVAVRLAREAIPAGRRVAGSIAPLEDCYRPDLSPADPRPEHREQARALHAAGCDLLLCETFPHRGEALIATEEAVATGLPVWTSFTAGPAADLMTPADVEAAAREAVRAGASAVLVNCVPAARTEDYVARLADLGVPFGAYANAGRADDRMGWENPSADAPQRYADLAERWLARGATLIGGCCGTGPAHIAALARRFTRAGRME